MAPFKNVSKVWCRVEDTGVKTRENLEACVARAGRPGRADKHSSSLPDGALATPLRHLRPTARSNFVVNNRSTMETNWIVAFDGARLTMWSDWIVSQLCRVFVRDSFCKCFYCVNGWISNWFWWYELFFNCYFKFIFKVFFLISLTVALEW